MITLDFESKDPHIDAKEGSGWVYKLVDPKSEFEVLGAAVRFEDGKTEYITDHERILQVADAADTYIMHNASYDLGCLMAMGFDISNKNVIDTIVMGRFHNSLLPSYKLDYLSKKYCNLGKDEQCLADAVYNSGIYALNKVEHITDDTKRNLKWQELDTIGHTLYKRPSKEETLIKLAKTKMKELQEYDISIVSQYAIRDVEATYKLYEFFGKSADMSLVRKFSNLEKICCKYRRNGVRIDLKRLEELNDYLRPKVAAAFNNVYTIVAKEFDILSPKQLTEAIIQHQTGKEGVIAEIKQQKVFEIMAAHKFKTEKEAKIKLREQEAMLPKEQKNMWLRSRLEELNINIGFTDMNNPSANSDWLEAQDMGFAKAILEARKLYKIHSDFIQKPLKMHRDGRLYPQLNLLGAHTGRFSCVPMSTRALTRNGWKTYGQLVVGEEILAYDMATKTQKWTPLLNKTKLTNQRVGSFGTRNRKLRCTAEHKWVVVKGHNTTHNGKNYPGKEKLVEAQNIKKGHRVLMNAEYCSNCCSNVDIFNTEKYSTKYEKLITRMSNTQLSTFVLGFLLADGHNSSPTNVGKKRGWQWTQSKTVTREQLLTATYLQHFGRLGVGEHHKAVVQNHNDSSRVTMCHSPYTSVSDTWKFDSIEDVWCPTTKYGTWIMREGDLMSITGNCSCPNIQQIPSDDEFGPMCRSIFLPEEGKKWFSLDFSNQEGRLQVHYAKLIRAEGAEELAHKWTIDPKFDLHSEVANLMNIENPKTTGRKIAKTINLGLSYGMGKGKLSMNLGLSLQQAVLLIQKYNDFAPYLADLTTVCKKTARTRGYIKSLSGRHLTFNEDKDYTVINQLIQGSAADQMIEAMIIADKEGIPILFPVHDQVCLSGTREQAVRMKEIMETCVKLEVPSVVDVDLKGGENWADAGH